MAQAGEGEPVQLEGEIFKDNPPVDPAGSSEVRTPLLDPAGSADALTPDGKIKRRRRVRTEGSVETPTEKPATQVIRVPRSQGGKYWWEED